MGNQIASTAPVPSLQYPSMDPLKEPLAAEPLTEKEDQGQVHDPVVSIDGVTSDILKLCVVILAFCMSHGLSRGLYPLVLLDAVDGSVSQAAYLQGAVMFAVHGLGFLVANPIL